MNHFQSSLTGIDEGCSGAPALLVEEKLFFLLSNTNGLANWPLYTDLASACLKIHLLLLGKTKRIIYETE